MGSAFVWRRCRDVAAKQRGGAPVSRSARAFSSFGLGRFGAAVLCLFGLTLVAPAQQPQFDVPPPRDVWIKVPVKAQEDWPRHFRIGMLVGMNIKADFRMSGEFPVSGSQPGATGVNGVDHLYDDGYVRVDDTGNAQHLTSFWGYNNPAQYDPVTHTLTMHSANSFSTTGSAKGDDSPYFGFDLAYGGQLGRWGPTRYGWEFGFGLLPISIEDKQPQTAVLNRTVHSFDTGGIVVPDAPYHGGPSGYQAPIRDLATSQPDDTTLGTVAGSRTLDVTLYVVRLGPLLHWELHPQWAVSLSAGPAVGYVDGELRFDEILQAGGGTGRNTGKITGSGVVYGGYVTAAVMYHAVEKGDFYVGVQYMPLSSMSVNGAGREACLNLAGGIYFSVGFNWPF